jgi:hypothetical protein
MTAQKHPFRFAGLVVVAVTMCLLVVLSHQLFRINKIVCTLEDGRQCPNNLQRQLDNMIGTAVFFTKYEALLVAEPFASEPYTLVSHNKILPDTLSVVFRPEPLLYGLKLDNGNTYYVGEKGSLMNISGNPDTNSIHATGPEEQFLTDHNTINPHFHSLFATTLSALAKHQFELSEISWQSPTEIKLKLRNAPDAIMDESNPALAVEKLALLLNSKNLEELEGQISVIDLRFEMPVLRTGQ